MVPKNISHFRAPILFLPTVCILYTVYNFGLFFGQISYYNICTMDYITVNYNGFMYTTIMVSSCLKDYNV